MVAKIKNFFKDFDKDSLEKGAALALLPGGWIAVCSLLGYHSVQAGLSTTADVMIMMIMAPLQLFAWFICICLLAFDILI